MLKPETMIHNRYLIKCRIGRGGQGTVYKAFDNDSARFVALKEALVEESEVRRAFEREAFRLRKLDHPVLPSMIEFFSEGEKQYLVMDYIEGDDLRDQLRDRKKPFPLEQVLKWGAQLLDALNYLHKQNPPLIHRDIKPANLKVTPEGNIILLDFGLAKGGLTEVSVEYSIPGFTRSYAPPEQMLGHTTDERSDLYALAVTLGHLLTAKKPMNAQVRLEAALRGMPDRARTMLERHEIPPATIEMLVCAMDMSPANRPKNALLMRAMLQEAMAEVADFPAKPLVSSNNSNLLITERLTAPQQLALSTQLTTQEARTSIKGFSESGTSVAPFSHQSEGSSVTFANEPAQSLTFWTNLAHQSSANLSPEEALASTSNAELSKTQEAARSSFKRFLIISLSLIILGSVGLVAFFALQPDSAAGEEPLHAAAVVDSTPTLTPTDADPYEENSSFSAIAANQRRQKIAASIEPQNASPTVTASHTSVAATPTSSQTPTEEVTTEATNTLSPTVVATSTLRPTSTNTRVPTLTNTRQATSTNTTQPAATNTPLPPPTATQAPLPSATQVPTTITYAQLILSQPEDNTSATSPVRLAWSWDGTLQADEWFLVRIWGDGQALNSINPTQESFYNFQTQTAGDYLWSVALIRGTNTTSPTILSQATSSRRFRITMPSNHNPSPTSNHAGGNPSPTVNHAGAPPPQQPIMLPQQPIMQQETPPQHASHLHRHHRHH